MSQDACLDQDQVLDSKLGLTELTEVEYSHLQHFIHSQMEAQARSVDEPDPRSYPVTVMDAAGSADISPYSSAQAIDLSVSGDDHCLLIQAEKTPVCCSEVPGFVLARISGTESSIPPTTARRTSSKKRPKPAARVCLEKRFASVSADTARQQDFDPTVINKLLTVLQGSAEGQEAVTQPQKLKWMKADRTNPLEVSNTYAGGVFDPVVAHVVELSTPQGFLYPKSFSFNLQPDSHVTVCAESDTSKEEKELEACESKNNVVMPGDYRSCSSSLCSPSTKTAKAAPDVVRKAQRGGWKRAQSGMSVSQRKERHNSKERERRKKIRLCCDELNTLVPFCDTDTDKVTTLQWTLTFLRYISIMYGDAFKEDFKKFFSEDRGMFLMSSSPSGHLQFHLEDDKSATVSLTAEQ